MSKFTIFTLFLSVTILVVVAELLANEYTRDPDLKQQTTANVLADSSASGTQQTNEPAIKNGGDENGETATYQNEGKITFTLIEKAGFANMTLQRVPFNGILFESIDLRDFKSVPIIQHHLLQNNRTPAATFYEFTAGTHLLAKEVYALLKEKSGKLIGAIINETNQFGESSFYVNFLERQENAFLVVKLGDNVYALTYRKEYHALVKQFITLLK